MRRVDEMTVWSANPISSFRKPSALPGFGLSLGYTLTYLTLIVLIPLAGLMLSAATLSWDEFANVATDQRVVNALIVSFGTAFAAALRQCRLRRHRRLGAGAL